MKLLCKFFVVCIAFGFYSCGDDGSNNSVANAPDAEQHDFFSSSGKADSIKKGSSSSVKSDESSSSEVTSSSSVKSDESSSSEVTSSSSVKPDESSSSIFGNSSSVVETSSNSQEVLGVCKTELEDYCTYGSLYDERDGKTYKTVKIGDQEWMAENLRYNDSTRSVCFTDDPNCDVFGRFYNRDGALNACPEGWHLPTEEEWLKLGKFVREHSEKGYPGQNLRTDSLWNVSGLGTGYDAFGFGAIPAGGYDSFDGWWVSGKNALFWISDTWMNGSQKCYTYTRLCYKVYNDDSDLMIGKSGGICVTSLKSKYSVRCIKD